MAIINIPSVVEAAAISVGAVSPNATVTAGTTVSFQIDQAGFAYPAYTLKDSLPGSTLSNAQISKSGAFSWTTTQADVGTHTVVITATDTNGLQATYTQTIYVREGSPVSVVNLSPGSSISPTTDTVSFSVSAAGFYNPTYSVSDSFYGTYGSSISYSNINSDGNFSWTPRVSDVGVHNLAVTVRSGTRVETIYQTITVKGIAITNVSSNTVTVGSQLSFAASPQGIGSPLYRVTDTARNNTIDNINISGNNFNWVPQSQDVGTHVITVSTSDGLYPASPLTITVVSASTASLTAVAGGGSGSTVGAVLGASIVNSSASGSASARYVFSANLNPGAKGAAVLELQKRLKTDGYLTATPNGVYGPATTAAVKKYQKAKGISQLGNVGPATRAALNKK